MYITFCTQLILVEPCLTMYCLIHIYYPLNIQYYTFIYIHHSRNIQHAFNNYNIPKTIFNIQHYTYIYIHIHNSTNIQHAYTHPQFNIQYTYTYTKDMALSIFILLFWTVWNNFFAYSTNYSDYSPVDEPLLNNINTVLEPFDN